MSKWALMVAAGFVATTLATSLPAIAETPVKGGTLTVALETDVRGFDAVKGGVLGASGGTVAFTIEEPLLIEDPKTGEYVPNLATSWTQSEDQKTWTFKLREGVKFHDGTEFTSKDVADHFNRILDPKNKARGRAFITAIERVDAVDKHTVNFVLKHPWLPLLGVVAAPNLNGLIPSHKNVEADKQNREPVGTGPFKFVSWAGGDRITVERNPDYWNKDVANVDKIVFRILPDTQSRFASLKSGEVDVIWTDRGSTIIQAQKDSDLTTIARDGKGAKIGFVNASKPPLDDVRVRQAINLAYNQNAVLNITWKKTVPFARHPLGTDSKCDAQYLEYNPEKAKALLADYGKPVSIEMIHTTTPRGRESGEIAQQALKKVGIDLKLVPVDQNTLVKKVFTNDYQMSGWRIADSNDVGPQIFALAHSKSPYNLARYKDEELDKLAVRMRSAKTAEDRDALQCEMIQKMNQSGTLRYRGGNRYYVFTRNNVKGVSISTLGRARVREAWKTN